MRLFFIQIIIIIPFLINAQNTYTLESNRIKISDNGIIYGYFYDTDDTLNFSDIKVPESVNGIKVIGIEAIGLPDKSIRKIDFPDNILYFGSKFLRDQLLDTIKLPSQLLYLGDWAFTNNNFASLKLPSPEKVNHNFTGWNDSIEGHYIVDLSIPQSITYNACFEYLNNEAYIININDVWEDKGNIKKCYYHGSKSIIISSNLGKFNITEIGKYSFYKMGLVNVVINENIEKIGVSAFSDNIIDKLILPFTIHSISKFAFARNRIKKLILPPNIKSIAMGSFENNLIEELQIPESVDSIKSRAFNNNKLYNIEIPAKVKYIGYKAFANNKFKEQNIPKLPFPKQGDKSFLYWQSFKKGRYIRETKDFEEIPVSQCKSGEKMDLNLGYKAVFKEDL